MSEGIKLLLSLSLSGSILAVIIFLLKPFIKNKISKSIQYYLWLIVLLRLIIPFSFEGSVMNNLFYGSWSTSNISISADKAQPKTFPEDSSIQSLTTPNVESKAEAYVNNNDVDHSRYLQELFNEYALYLWILGIIVVILYNFMGYFLFSRRLTCSNMSASEEQIEVLKSLLDGRHKNLKLVRNTVLNTPMLLGILNPCMIIPDNNYNVEQLKNILHHEITHLKRLDIAVKWFVMIVSAFHWFNPVMYFVKKEINSACELACDEAVIKNLSTNQKQSYGETLISVVSEHKCPNGMLQATMCEEKKTLKERLVAIMKHKKKSKVVIIVSVLLLVGAVVGALLLGPGVGVVEKEPPKLYVSTETQKKEVLTGSYSWQFFGGAINADSMHPTEFYYRIENMLDVKSDEQIVIGTLENKFLKGYDYSLQKATLYLGKKEVSNNVKIEKRNGYLYMSAPSEEGNYVCELILDYKDKGTVVYGFKLTVGMDSQKFYSELNNIAIKLGVSFVETNEKVVGIKLPTSAWINGEYKKTDDTTKEKNGLIAEILLSRNEMSKNLIGKDFLDYLGKNVRVMTFRAEKDNSLVGEILILNYTGSIVGAWLDTNAGKNKNPKVPTDFERLSKTFEKEIKFNKDVESVTIKLVEDVVKSYFALFEKQDYNAMKSISTENHNKFVHSGDVWGMKWAKAKEIKFAYKVNDKIFVTVSVDCETVTTSAQYPSKQSFFYLTLAFDEKSGKWKIDEYTTG